MPDAYSPWVDAAQSFGGIGPALNNIAIGLANQRLREQQFFQQLELEQQRNMLQSQHYQQQGQLYGAQTDLARQRTRDLESAGVARRDLGAGLERLPGQLAQVPSYPDMLPDEEWAAQQDLNQLIGQVLGAIGRLPASASTGMGEKIAQMMAIRDPVQAQILAQGGASKLGVTVPSGATHVSAVPGMPTVTGSANIPQGNVRIPATVDGVPEGEEVVGLPPRSTSKDLDLNRALASNQALYRAIVGDTGIAPKPGSANFPLFQQTTNQLGMIGQLMGRDFQTRLGTNAAPVAPIAPAPAQSPREDLTRRVPKPIPMIGKEPNKAALQVGELYNTVFGPAIWDGTNFVQPD